MSTIMDYIINLLFTLLQVVTNDKIIRHIVIVILIKADLMGKCLRNKAQEDFVSRL